MGEAFTRRSVLKAVGATSAGCAAFTGTAAAKPKPKIQSLEVTVDHEEDTVTFTYEVTDKDGDLARVGYGLCPEGDDCEDEDDLEDSGTEQVSGEYATGSLTSNPVPEGGYTWIFGVEDEEGDYRYETGGVMIE